MKTTDIRSRGEVYFELGREAARMLFSTVKTLSAEDTDELACRTVMLFFAAKALKNYQAARLLWISGFEEDALVITRTLLEIQLQARYIYDDHPRARTFILFDPVSRYRYYQELERLRDEGVDVPEVEGDPEELERLRSAHDEHAGSYTRSPNWWGTTVRDLAGMVGKPAQARYAILYKLSSDLVHSGVTSVKHYLTDPENKGEPIELNCNPRMVDDLKVPQQATLLVLETMWYVLIAFNAQVDEEINGLLERFKALEAKGDVPDSAEL